MNIRSKAQVKAYVEAERMTSVLNNTKWKRLFDLLNESPIPFRYRRTDIDGTIFPKRGQAAAGEIAQVYGEFWSMEQLEIGAVIETRTGMLTAPKIESFIDDLIALANAAGVKFTVFDGGIRVYGYIRRPETASVQSQVLS